MIDQEIRTALLQKTIGSDFEAAAQIYEKNTKRPIYPRYLDKFLRGERNPTGRHPASHDPGQMFAAIAEAVAERQRRERQYSEDARRRLTELIMRDTSPHQPMPL